MTTRCSQCGRDNDESALRCACGSDLPAQAASVPAAASAPDPVSHTPPAGEAKLVLRKIVFVVWAIGFVPLFAWLHSYLHVSAAVRCLIGGGVFCAPAVAALWFLGREKRPSLRVWRAVFVSWMILLTPVLLSIAEGVVTDGWPRGRHNRLIAHFLTMLLILTVPAFLTGLLALIRTYRLAGVLALATDLASLVNGTLLIRATSSFRIWSRIRARSIVDVLDVVVVGSKVEGYLAIPVGIALIVGGIMVLRAAWTARADRALARNARPEHPGSA